MSDMTKIEQYQKELGEFLISAMPVPWEKIVFFTKCTKYSSSIRFAFREKETQVNVTIEFFYRRYHNYPFTEREINSKLFDLSEKIFNA